MKRLDRYIISSVTRILVLTESVCLVIFLIIEFFEHMDLFMTTIRNFLLGMAYLFLRIPYYFNIILPLAFLISILIVLLIMIRNNELIVVRTSGISTASFIRPFIFLSVLLVVISFSVAEFITPATSSTSEYIYRVKIKKEEPYIFFKNDRIWLKRGNLISNIEFFDTRKDLMKGITVIEITDSYFIKRRMDAREGVWKDNTWIFRDVIERTFDEGGIKSTSRYPELKGVINEPPSAFKIAEKNPEEMGYGELSRYIRKMAKNGHDVRRYLVDLYNKIAFPFINTIMVFTACSVGLRYRKTKHISKGIVTGIFLGLLYWIVHSISLAFGYSDLFPPLFAAWFSNILFFSAGMVGVVTLRT